ncbi:MAG TPA: archease [Alphaproteobacteria bacterium]|nr:archease [Alphaproteobacteria bacterium]
MADRKWEHFPHSADIGIRGRGDTVSEAFQNAALAMTAVIADPAVITAKEPVDIHCEAPDLELLLVDWLNALVFEMATRGMLFSRFDVSIEAGRLSGQAFGEAVDRARHHPVVEIKGATMTALRVAEDTDGTYVAECVVDV